MNLPGQWLMDWGGAQRWLKSDAQAADIRRETETAGGHATLFRRAGQNGASFHPLPAAVTTLQQNLKRAFDPEGRLNAA
jgi:glycolate oxidase FAD binding subunit